MAARAWSPSTTMLPALRARLCFLALVIAAATTETATDPLVDASQLVPEMWDGVQIGTITAIEAENFTLVSGFWEALPWAHSKNYFASTVSNVFHSRRAYLHAPRNASTETVAQAALTIAADGTYSVLARYEALYRFNMPFTIRIAKTATSAPLFTRTYGLRGSLKVWGFAAGRTAGSLCGPGLQAECLWPWGATENMVWEGVGAEVRLAAGSYVMELAVANTSTPSKEGIYFADRNIDVIMLVPNATDVSERLVHENQFLALDGLLNQAGEVFFQVENHGPAMNLTIPRVYGHSPYYQMHLFDPAQGKGGSVSSGCSISGGRYCKVIPVAAGATTEWIDVGYFMDVFNHGSWNFKAGLYGIKVGVKTGGAISTTFGPFESQNETLQLLFDASTRASKRVRGRTADFFELMTALDAQTPVVHGKVPTLTPIYATMFSAGAPDGGGSSATKCPNCGAPYAEAQKRFVGMYGFESRGCVWQGAGSPACIEELRATKRGYVDLRSAIRSPASLAEALQGLKNASLEDNVLVVSLGDEIQVRGGNISDPYFVKWCEAAKLTPADVGCASWTACPVDTNLANVTSAATAQRYYFSTRFVHDTAIAHFKGVTAQIKAGLPNAQVGANFSPTFYLVDPRNGKQYCHAYLGVVYQWIDLFRGGGATLPWSEDWVWQTPVATQQVVTLLADVMRAGVAKAKTGSEGGLTRDASVWSDPYAALHDTNVPYVAAKKIPTAAAPPLMMYVMGHSPGNTPRSWRRQFYGDIAHGVKIFDLFMFETSQSGYTCDYIDQDAGTYEMVRQSVNELGLFEDIVQKGAAQARGAAVALLYSGSADIWLSPTGTSGAAKRMLYIALRHAQLPVDVLTEADCEDGDLLGYNVLYVLDKQVRERAVTAIQSWVKAGGTAIFTPGAAAQNEFNATNKATGLLFPGITQTGLWTGTRFSRENSTIYYGKQDLAFAEELDAVTILATTARDAITLPVLGEKPVFTFAPPAGLVHNITGYFEDASPAVIEMGQGKGIAVFMAVHPGFSYFRPALPFEPACRGATDDAYNHWIPRDFDVGVRDYLFDFVADVPGARPVVCSEPLVEVGLINGFGAGYVLPLINWSGQNVTSVNVTLGFDISFKTATMASGANVTVVGQSLFTTVEAADAIILR